MSNLIDDVRKAFRGLRRSPGFTAVAVVSVALAIGINTAIFGVANALLARPLTASAPERLLRIGATDRGQGFTVLSHLDYRDIAAQASAFTGVLAHQVNAALLEVDGVPLEEPMEIVSGNYFDVVGILPIHGRGFRPEEDADPGARAVAVLSHSLWVDRFDSDGGVVGRSISVNGSPFTVVGVAPAGFTGTFPGFIPRLWLPLMMRDRVLPTGGALDARDEPFLNVIGRLRAGATRTEAAAQLQTIAARLETAYPSTHAGRGLTVADAHGVHPMFASVAAPFLGMLMGMVALVLLIACANLANMTLARAARRSRQTAVRRALGASRWRLVRYQLIESVLVALCGGAAGVLASNWISAALAAMRPPAGLPAGIGLDVPIDVRVLLFSLLASLGTGVAIGVAPAWGAARPEIVAALRDGGASRGRRNTKARAVLVIAQVAVSAVLLVGAGLVMRTLLNSRDLDAGFDAARQAVVRTDPSVLGYTDDRALDFWRRLGARAAESSQVSDTALALFVPLGSRSDRMSVAATLDEATSSWPSVNYNVVSPGYFDLLGIPLPQGRDFHDSDRRGAADVAIVNRTLARRLWNDRSPVGQRLYVIERDGTRRDATVVGVADDIKYRDLGEPPTPFFYLPHAQWNRMDLVLHVRAAGNTTALLAALREPLRGVDPQLPLELRSLAEEMAYSLTVPRIVAAVLAVAGGVGLLLATLGIFGVVSYATTQRFHEIGVRMAVGADRGAVRRLIVGQGIRVTAVGLVFGLVGGATAARLLAGILYGVAPTDPATHLGIALLMLVAAGVASYVPARRASTIDPAAILRAD